MLLKQSVSEIDSVKFCMKLRLIRELFEVSLFMTFLNSGCMIFKLMGRIMIILLLCFILLISKLLDTENSG